MLVKVLTLALTALVSLTNPAISRVEGSNRPFPIFEDEIYRRDGALPSIRTCLAVADDAEAASLLSSFEDEAEHALAEALQDARPSVKRQPGFGTLMACARIVEAWYAARISESGRPLTIASDLDDGRAEHGAIVVDLLIAEGERGRIAPVPLVRILTSDGLLPPAVFGGMVVRNARIDGALVFHNAHLSNPLAFAGVDFLGGDYSKDVFGIEEPVIDTALAIVHSRLADHLQIVDSVLCGDIRIFDSHLRETLVFDRVRQRAIGDCGPREEGVSKTLIDGNRFDQGLSIRRSRFQSLSMDGNDVDTLMSSRSEFGSRFKLWNNDLGSLQIDCSLLARRFDLSYNHIAQDAFIYGSRHDKSFPPEETPCPQSLETLFKPLPERATVIVISSNQIGGGIGLQGLDGGRFDPEIKINLKSNRVGNGSEIALPATEAGVWPGRFELQGSTYHGTLRLKADGELQDDRPDAGTYCDGLTSDRHAVFDLTAVDVRVLEWDIPLGCAYRWSGYGLSYDLWLAVHERSTRSDFQPGKDDQAALARWRQILEKPEAAPLNAMSRYFVDNGSSVNGRTILLEAKRLNYAPGCPPDRSTLGCIADLLGLTSLFTFKSASAEAVVAGNHPADASPFSSAFDAITLFLLWPGGFGAAPEQALLWLIGMTLGCWAAYAGYSLYLSGKLRTLPAERSCLQRIRSALNAPSGRAGSPAESEDKPTIAEAQTAVDGLIDHWPEEPGFAALDRGERLELVRKTLIPEARSCEEFLLGRPLAELRTLRQRLERFGNTEKLGFSLFNQGKMPVRFTYGRYAIDTMLPFIDLHAYNNYYPEWWPFRMLSVTQHVCGWWWLTVFIASAAIL